MPTTTPAAGDQPGTATPPAITRLVSVTGAVEPAAPRDVEQTLAAGGFFWLDLQNVDPGRLEQFGRSLRLDPSAIAGAEDNGQSSGLAMTSTGVQRPSLAAVGDSIQALVPAAGGTSADDPGIPVRIVYTSGFLLTSHSEPCPALERARHRYAALGREGKGDGPLVFFLVLDDLAGSFPPQFLMLDGRLGEIQTQLLTSASRDAQAEVLAIRRRLTPVT